MSLRFFETVHGWLERVSHVAVWVGGGALLLSAIMVTVDVLCRIDTRDEVAYYETGGILQYVLNKD